MSLKQKLFLNYPHLPTQFFPLPDGTIALETIVAQRKSFFAQKKLTYHCRLKIDESRRRVRFFEMLQEHGWRLAAGGDDEFSPAANWRHDCSSRRTGRREESIETQSHLYKRQYHYRVDFSQVRRMVQQLAALEGYDFEVCLREKALQS